MATETFRITYATMKADNEDLQSAYDRGIETAKSWLGQKHPFYVNGEAREGESWFEERSPIDRDISLGTFAQASRQDVKDAIQAAIRPNQQLTVGALFVQPRTRVCLSVCIGQVIHLALLCCSWKQLVSSQ